MSREDFLQDLKSVKALAPRIEKVWDMCQEMIDRGVTMGENTRTYLCGMGIVHEFQTEGVFHQLGFLLDRGWDTIARYNKERKIVAFGIEGGGYCGHSVFFNKDGSPHNFDPDKKVCCNPVEYGVYVHYPHEENHIVKKVKTILRNFDNFENRVIDYYNKTIKK